MSVSLLKHEERARFDPDRLEQLCRDVGEVQAEHEAADALDRINRALKGIEHLGEPEQKRRLLTRLNALIAASDKIGMSTLGRVARDVRHCARIDNRNALAATLSRLGRVG
ncbi:MAG: hypothetical protein AAF768_13455, partial [Pseudomonadota bacterium]